VLESAFVCKYFILKSFFLPKIEEQSSPFNLFLITPIKSSMILCCFTRNTVHNFACTHPAQNRFFDLNPVSLFSVYLHFYTIPPSPQNFYRLVGIVTSCNLTMTSLTSATSLINALYKRILSQSLSKINIIKLGNTLKLLNSAKANKLKQRPQRVSHSDYSPAHQWNQLSWF